MIQRIQSIFLLLAAAGFGSLFFVPIAKSNKGFGEIYANQALDVQDHIGLIGLTAGGAILALISIFLFNNRKLQVAMSSFAAILVLPLIGLSYFYSQEMRLILWLLLLFQLDFSCLLPLS